MSTYTLKAPLELADGEVETEIQIAKVGEYEHASFGKFAITPQHCEEMARNYAAELGAGHERMVTIGHPKSLDGAPAAGWLKSVRAAADGLFARVALLPETAKRIKAGEFRYFSPTFTTSGKDESGKSIGARLLSGAITNDPFLKGMKPFELSALEAAAQEPDVADNDTTIKLAEAEAKAITLSEQVKSLSEQVAQKDAQILALSEQVRTHELALTATTIKDTVEKAERDGKLSPALRDTLLPGVADDPVKALAASPFRDAKALADYFSKAPVVVDLGSRKSADGVEAVSLSADDPQHPDILKLAKASGVKPEYLARAAKSLTPSKG